MTTGNEPPVPAEPTEGDGHADPAPHTPQPRARNNRNGRFEPSQATADRAAEAARLKAENPKLTYRQIAAAVGYHGPGEAWRAIERCRKAALETAGAELIASEAALLDEQFVAAMEILDREHLMVSHGRIVKDDAGTPLLDDGPRLAALREMRAIRESYRKLYGADAATKVEHSGGVTYELVGIQPEDVV